MSKQLIIAEKPSVAGDIARVLGGFKRHDDYFESEIIKGYLASSGIIGTKVGPMSQGSGLVRAVITTPANINDTVPADDLIRGDEAAVYADKAYDTHARRARLKLADNTIIIFTADNGGNM